MKSEVISSIGKSFALLAVVVAGLFAFTGLSLGSVPETEVTSVAAESSNASPEVLAEVLAESVSSESESKLETEEQNEEPESQDSDSSRSLQSTGPFVGDAEIDFDPATNPNVVVIVDPGGNDDVGVPASLQGVTSGLDIRDFRYFYESATDELFIAINYNGIGGDPDGDGDVATGVLLDPVNVGNDFGNDPANWVGETFAVLLDTDGDGTADIIAGVSDLLPITDFAVAEASPLAAVVPGNAFAYGVPIPGAIGLAPTDTSPTRPDIEFSIANFSTLIDPNQPNLGLSAFTASTAVEGFGSDSLPGPGQFNVVDNPTISTGTPEIDIETSTNGIDADLPAQGPELPVGTDATIEYVVTNTGDVDLVDVTITDETGTQVAVIPNLAVGETESISAIVVVAPGQTANSGDVTGFQDDGTGNPTGAEVSDTDPTHHSGVEAPAPGLDVEKTLFGEDLDDPNGDLPTFAVGSTITFDFEVSNTGNTTIVDISLTDNVLGAITCPRSELGAGEAMVCSGNHVVTEGQVQNVATVGGQPVDADGNPIGDPLEAEDPANHIGATTAISIEKSTNGEDADTPSGPEVEAGDDVVFTYVVSNSGPADVADVVVTDNLEGFVCEIALLEANSSETCELTSTATIGDYANIGEVVGQPIDENGNPIGAPLEAADPSHHVGVCSAVVDGPVLFRGGQTIWNTTLVAGDDSTIVLSTSENGGSPGQPNEQVYVEVAGVLYGPSPAGLGTITLDIAEGGQVRVLHISEVESGLFSANSVVPSLCGDDLNEIVPVCTSLIPGPLLLAQGRTTWDTGLVVGDNSTLRVVTSENGGSPNQPHEQVYVQVGNDTYGPTFAGLGDIEFDITDGGPVTIRHYSEVTGDRSSQNSVIPSICGDDLSAAAGPTCPTTVSGPRLVQGEQTIWDAQLTADAGSEITIVTDDQLSNFVQPNEQVYVLVGDDVYGPTPAGRGELTFTVTNSGAVSVHHYSEINGRQNSQNSVDFELCGSGLTRLVEDFS